MNTVQVKITGIDEAAQDVLIAELSEAGYEGFEQMPDALLAYIAEDQMSEQALNEILNGKSWVTELLSARNWNSVWESNFQPVVVEGFCTIRADFHEIKEKTPYEIVITPKMSFGTGHHATTRLVMTAMKNVDFTGKKVLDFGSGTGILAILAEMLGATEVLGIDNDEWAITNGVENAARNGCTNTTITAIIGDELPGNDYDVILANINRNILLDFMSQMYDKVKPGGTVIMSGLLTVDRAVITGGALEAGFTETGFAEQDNWITLSFIR
jgi:ribosomal protein L11 methyltransferase